MIIYEFYFDICSTKPDKFDEITDKFAFIKNTTVI
jgi:hypothetical protein